MKKNIRLERNKQLPWKKEDDHRLESRANFKEKIGGETLSPPFMLVS